MNILVSKSKNYIKQFVGKYFKKIFSLYPGFENIKIILLYHRVLHEIPEGLYDPSLFVTSSTFEMHIKEISKLFEIVPLEKIIQTNNGTSRLCAITFDDGWIDNYEVAFPIVKKYQIPVTIFISPEIIGSNHVYWFESLWSLANRVVSDGNEPYFINYFHKFIRTSNPARLNIQYLSNLTAALKTFPGNTLDDLIASAYIELNLAPSARRTTMDWDQVLEMGQHGVTFGSHGLHHYILTTLDSISKRREVFESLKILREKNVEISSFFSYPNGYWDDESIKFVPQAGYTGGLTAEIGYNTSSTPRFLLKRIGIHENISKTPELLWFRIFQSLISGSKPSKLGKNLKSTHLDY